MVYNKFTDSEKTKYLTRRDGNIITIEDNDYSEAKELVRDMENTPDERSSIRQNQQNETIYHLQESAR